MLSLEQNRHGSLTFPNSSTYNYREENKEVFLIFWHFLTEIQLTREAYLNVRLTDASGFLNYMSFLLV